MKKMELRLNIKKTKLMTTVTAIRLRSDNKDMVDSFSPSGLTVNTYRTSSLKIATNACYARVAINALEKIFRCHESVSTYKNQDCAGNG